MRAQNLIPRVALLITVWGLSGNLHAEVTLEGLWIRAMPPGHGMTAGYGRIHNSGPEAVQLSSAHAAIAGRLELHTTLHSEGRVHMKPLAYPALAPGETFTLVPGGAHLMLLDIAAMPEVGASIELCVVLADGTSRCGDALVSRVAPMEHTHHGKHP